MAGVAIGAVFVVSMMVPVQADTGHQGAVRGASTAASRARPAATSSRAEPTETPVPTRWLSALRRCRREPRRRFCDGPRRVPEPQGRAAELAQGLGLGAFETVKTLFNGPTPRRWVRAVAQRPETSLLWPAPEARIGRGLGRWHIVGRDRYHNGVDMPAPGGTPIRAANAGLVAYSDNGVHGMGNVLMLLHGDGTLTVYAHMRAIYVFPGQQVRRGQTVGEVGTTGISRGNHLHFEWRRNGVPIDPVSELVDFPLGDDGFPLFARVRPRRDAAPFRGFGFVLEAAPRNAVPRR